MRTLLLIVGLAAGVSGLLALDLNNPSGNRGLILIDKRGGSVRFADAVNFTESGDLQPGTQPHDLVISPDHKTAYVTIYGDGVYGKNPHPGHEIAVIDLATKKLVKRLDVAPYQAPHGIQIDSSGTLYVTCDLSRKLLLISPQTGKIEAAIDTEGTGHWVALLPDASKAYIANKNDKPFITVIDLKSRKVIREIPMPNGTQGIAVSPDGKLLVAVDFRDPTLTILDTSNDSVLQRVPLAQNTAGAFKPRFTPDGKYLFVCNETQGLVNVLETSNLSGPQHVIAVGKNPMGFAFTQDGKMALVSNHGEGTVSVIDIASMREIRKFNSGTGVETLAFY